MIEEGYFEDASYVIKSLSSPLRLRALNYLSFAPRTVEDCAKKFSQSIQNMSLHLQALKKAGLIELQKVKNFHFYYVKNLKYLQFISTTASIQNLYSLPEEFRFEGSIKELSEMVKLKNIILIDIRDQDEREHLKLPFSLTEVSSPKNKKIIYGVVCRGPWCEKLKKEVLALRSQGFNAKGICYTAYELDLLASTLKDLN